MMDLTGAPCKEIDFNKDDIKGQIADGSLWNRLKHYDEENYVMAVSSIGNVTSYIEKCTSMSLIYICNERALAVADMFIIAYYYAHAL